MNWKNVNNWHWIEKDCTEWAHQYLKEKLLFTSGSHMYEALSIKGEVSVNVRKGKVRQIYDLEIELSGSAAAAAVAAGSVADDNATAVDSAAGAAISVKIMDFMSDASCAQDLDIRFPAEMEWDTKKGLREQVWAILKTFQVDLEKEQGVSLLNSSNESAANGAVSGGAVGSDNIKVNDIATTATSKENAKSFNSSMAVCVGGEKEEKVFDVSSFEEEITFNSPANTVFDALTRPELIGAWSRGSAKFSGAHSGEPLKVGSTFTLLGGNIETMVTGIVLGKSFEADWRLRSWPSGHYSKVSISLSDERTTTTTSSSSNRTALAFKQSGVPSAELSLVKSNWTRYYWEPIKEILGCGNIGNLL